MTEKCIISNNNACQYLFTTENKVLAKSLGFSDLMILTTCQFWKDFLFLRSSLPFQHLDRIYKSDNTEQFFWR